MLDGAGPHARAGPTRARPVTAYIALRDSGGEGASNWPTATSPRLERHRRCWACHRRADAIDDRPRAAQGRPWISRRLAPSGHRRAPGPGLAEADARARCLDHPQRPPAGLARADRRAQRPQCAHLRGTCAPLPGGEAFGQHISTMKTQRRVAGGGRFSGCPGRRWNAMPAATAALLRMTGRTEGFACTSSNNIEARCVRAKACKVTSGDLGGETPDGIADRLVRANE